MDSIVGLIDPAAPECGFGVAVFERFKNYVINRADEFLSRDFVVKDGKFDR